MFQAAKLEVQWHININYWQADGLAASKYEKNHWRLLKGVE